MHEPLSPLTTRDIDSAVTGGIPPAPVPWLYRAGLAAVALGMIVLPLCYVAVIGLAGWAVWWHLFENTWIVSGQGGGRSWRLLAYLAPAVVGIIVLFFLVKPLLARAGKGPDPLELTPEQEPVLFAFIGRICDLVRAPRPARVRVDCRVNASASFDGALAGLAQRRLVLTIGLPLAGLSARQLGGVLAHEFGHFAQGAGMGVTYIIRRVNGWFGRVVYERDAWDERLADWSRNTDGRLALVLMIARGGVWLSRRILFGLMWVGHAISCFMLRQMEFDADYYETAVAGSPTFAQTTRRMRELSLACEGCYDDLGRILRTGAAASDLPSLVLARVGMLRADAQAAIDASLQTPRTGLFDTHPSDAERLARAAGLRFDGVLELDTPATRLFTDFGRLSAAVTQQHYADDLGLDVGRLRLVDTASVMHEAQAGERAEQARAEFCHQVPGLPRPLSLMDASAVPTDTAAAAARLRSVTEAVAQGAAHARAAAERFSEVEDHLHDILHAAALLDAGLNIEAREFGLQSGTRADVDAALEAARTAYAAALAPLEAFERLQRERLTLALALAGTHAGTAGDGASERREVARSLGACLDALAGQSARIDALRREHDVLAMLLGNRKLANATNSVTRNIARASQQARALATALTEALAATPYPFHQAQEGLSIGAHLRGGAPLSQDPDALAGEVRGVIHRYWTMYFEALGRAAMLALRVEAALTPPTAASGPVGVTLGAPAASPLSMT